jgi:signal transduction histidine kinase
VEDQENRDRHIKRIKESVNHLNDILEDFLSLGRMDEGRIVADPVEFNLKTLIEETMADFKMLLKNGQHIQCTYQCDEIVYADKRLLKNIIINLVSNASKFSDEGAAIEINAASESENILLSVIDHGIGISEDDQEHLFSSFFRGSNASNIQGTGLGLHIVKRYTDLMGGTVHLQSQQGVGTTIKVSFPSIQKYEQ